jgi:uncharacterized protein YbaR (Trm112 family)
MAVDPELLSILVCPQSKGELELVSLPDDVRRGLIEKYREHFRDETPVVESGLFCSAFAAGLSHRLRHSDHAHRRSPAGGVDRPLIRSLAPRPPGGSRSSLRPT